MKLEIRKFLGFIVLICISAMGFAETCSTVGETQNKYTASGCGYTTQTRTCCSNGNWSDWDKDCACSGAECCSSNQCWNGSECEEYLKDKCGTEAVMRYSICRYNSGDGFGWAYVCQCSSNGQTGTYGNNDTVTCPDLSCSSGSVASVSVTSYTLDLSYSNKNSLCSHGWGNSYNSQCQTDAANYFSSKKCYTGYKKTNEGDFCISSYTGAGVEPIDISDFNYKMEQLCTYGRSMGTVRIACKLYGVYSTCW